MLIQPQILADRIRNRRCAKTAYPLGDDEHVVSATAFPCLYKGGATPAEAEYLRELLRPVMAMLEMNVEASTAERVRLFMSQVIHNGNVHKEDFVHNYLFHFWERTWTQADDPIILSERYFQGDCEDPKTTFARNFLPKFRSKEAIVDIVGLGGVSSRTLYLVEVKLGEIDDRAVGQILRYYLRARHTCDFKYHNCDIRRIAPVLITRPSRIDFWEAFPFYFREFLHIYYYQVDSQGELRLSDGRKLLLSTLRDGQRNR